MKKKNKYTVTVNGFIKLLVAFVIFAVGFLTKSSYAFLALTAYTFIFIYLAILGSNSKFCEWLSARKFMIAICIFPSIALAFYTGISASETLKDPMGAFSLLLTIGSIPIALLFARFHGGIRRYNHLISFIAFPLIVYILCILFAETAMKVAAISGAVACGLCFVASCFDMDHKVDFSSRNDNSERGNYKARWESQPDSSVRDKVIHLRGTIIVEYTGTFFQDSADEVAQRLIQAYIARVSNEMPGYAVDKSTVQIKCVKVG